MCVCVSVESALRRLTSVDPAGHLVCSIPAMVCLALLGGNILAKAFSLGIEQGRLCLFVSVDLPWRLVWAGVGLLAAARRHTRLECMHCPCGRKGCVVVCVICMLCLPSVMCGVGEAGTEAAHRAAQYESQTRPKP